MEFDLNKLLRPNIKNIVPYSSARSEFKGDAKVFLDANENPFDEINEELNRYPDPLQLSLKSKLSAIKNIDSANIFLGNGSDEAIDLVIRAFCEPGTDSIVICPPTYGMYQVSAAINDVEVVKSPLTQNFQLDTTNILSLANNNKSKLIFVCSPNNPTGNCLNNDDIQQLLVNFEGIVIIDEAYIDFATQSSWVEKLHQYPNLIVMQTFSKAWGLAGIRLGCAYASKEIINVINNIKPPYNINKLTIQSGLTALSNEAAKNELVANLIAERQRLQHELDAFNIVVKIHSSDANFLLVEFKKSQAVFEYLKSKGIIVRDRSKQLHCENCLRITVGTEKENKKLIEALAQF